MVIDHDFDVAEDLAVSAVGFLARLSETAHALPVEGAMGLRVEHKGHGQQALDPFCAGQQSSAGEEVSKSHDHP